MQEARCLQRARKCGVDAPLIIFVDGINHRIYMERVPGVTVKAYLQDVQQRRKQLLEGSTTTTTPEAAAEILARDDGSSRCLSLRFSRCVRFRLFYCRHFAPA